MTHIRLTVALDGLPDVDLTARVGTPLADVLAVVGLSAPAWHVGPRTVSPTDVVGAHPLLDGARVSSGSSEPVAALEVLVVAGHGVGRRAPLADGPLLVGRSEEAGLRLADPAVSRRHAAVELSRGSVSVRDLGTTNGSHVGGCLVGGGARPWPVGDVVRVGSTWLRLVSADRTGPTSAAVDGTVPVDATPSRPSPPPHRRLSRPAPPSTEACRAFPWTVVTVTLAASVLVASVLRSPLLLLLGLTGPLTAVATTLTDRRRVRTANADARNEHARAEERFRVQLSELLDDETSRRRQVHDTAFAAQAARTVTGLWSAPELAWAPGRARLPSDSVELVGEEPPALDDVPDVVPLCGGALVVVEGKRADDVVRALVLQATTQLGPDRLALAVHADQRSGAGTWAWLDLLPHRRRDLDDLDPSSLVEGPLVLVVHVDTGPVPTPGARCVVVSPMAAGRTADLRLDLDAPGRPLLRRTGSPPLAVDVDGVDAETADDLARALAPLRTARRAVAALPPDSVSLHDLTFGRSSPTSADVAGTWRGRASLGPVPIGHDGAGPVMVDLATDGPHMLVGGTTGSGKSELLTTLLLSLALAHSPEVVTFLVIDFKGGATAGGVGDLPHVVGVVTDLDRGCAARALAGLDAELKRREHELARLGAKHIDDAPSMRRLVIVVDEYRVLAEEQPAFLAGLLRVATTGRSLGVHLVLATQRPAGIVSADVRANVSLRIALRLNDIQDSRDVVDSADAARIPPSLPGRALLRRPDGTLEVVQIAHAEAPPTAELPDVVVGAVATRRASREDGSALARLVALTVRAAEELGIARPPSPVPAPLPDRVAGESLAAGSGLPLGVVDLPSEQRCEVYAYDPRRDGHLAVVGVARSGRSTAARQLVHACVTGAQDRHVHVIGDAALVQGLHGPRVGSVVPTTSARLVRRLLDLLRHGCGVPTLLVVDGWSSVLAGTDPMTAMDLQAALVRLLAEGPGRDVHAVVTGERNLLSGSVGSHLTSRLVLRLADPTELALVGLGPARAAEWGTPGRALRPDGAPVQIALAPARAQSRGTAREPVRLVPLPSRVAGMQGTGVLGLGGDHAEPVRLPSGQPTLLVTGPPGSGRTTTLEAIAAASRHPVWVTPDPRPGRITVDPAEAERLATALTEGADTVLVDDLDAVLGSPSEDVLVAATHAGGPRVVVVASPERMAGAYRGLAGTLRRNRCGLLLMPRAASDGDPLGVRLVAWDEPVPGRGVLVVGDRQTVLHVALPDPSAAADE